MHDRSDQITMGITSPDGPAGLSKNYISSISHQLIYPSFFTSFFTIHHSLLLINMRTRRNRYTAPTPAPKCDHCGSTGHISSICSRRTYSPDLPSLTCTACIRTVRSAYREDPDYLQIIVHIDPCSLHSTPTIRPNRPIPTTNHRLRTSSTSRPTPPPPPPTVSGLAPRTAAAPQPPPAPAPLAPAPLAPAPPTPAPQPPAPQPAPAQQPVTDQQPAPNSPQPPAQQAAPGHQPATDQQPAPNAAALPTGRRTRRIFSLDGVIAEYDAVVQLVNSGLSKSAALEQIHISRSHFSRKRCIAEAAKVDLPGVQHALLQLRDVRLPSVYTFANEICNRNLATLRTLCTQGVVLAPKNNYTAPPPPRRN